MRLMSVHVICFQFRRKACELADRAGLQIFLVRVEYRSADRFADPHPRHFEGISQFAGLLRGDVGGRRARTDKLTLPYCGCPRDPAQSSLPRLDGPWRRPDRPAWRMFSTPTRIVAPTASARRPINPRLGSLGANTLPADPARPRARVSFFPARPRTVGGSSARQTNHRDANACGRNILPRPA